MHDRLPARHNAFDGAVPGFPPLGLVKRVTHRNPERTDRLTIRGPRVAGYDVGGRALGAVSEGAEEQAFPLGGVLAHGRGITPNADVISGEAVVIGGEDQCGVVRKLADFVGDLINDDTLKVSITYNEAREGFGDG